MTLRVRITNEDTGAQSRFIRATQQGQKYDLFPGDTVVLHVWQADIRLTEESLKDD